MADLLRARVQFGNQLRRARQEAGMTGKQLAGSLGWAASKVSRLENGRQTATSEDVRAWARGVAAPAVIQEELLAGLYALRIEYEGWQRRVRRGHAALQTRAQQMIERAAVIRVFQPALIPGLLQTPAYARSVLHASIVLNEGNNDVEEAVRARLAWQHVLYGAGRQFHFLLTDGALARQVASAAVHREALDRLRSLARLDSVDLAVVRSETAPAYLPGHGFWVCDDTLVQIETLTGSVNLREPDDVQVYVKVFDSVAEIALTGTAADGAVAAVSARIGNEPPSG